MPADAITTARFTVPLAQPLASLGELLTSGLDCMLGSQTGGGMLSKMPELGNCFQPPHDRRACNGIMGIVYVQGETDEVRILFECHSDSVGKDCSTSGH